jgi:RHH-type proline utilization regulon transcriptional repressor/proline dehydrogenase/delta 1-pyrroline-5-carboxylate dehydrogenase
MKNDSFKIQLFRFVDAFPSLKTPGQIADHIREYFGPEEDLPAIFAAGTKAAGILGRVTGAMAGSLIHSAIHEMANQFIIGETTDEALIGIARLRSNGFAAVLDVLGEATLSEGEAESYVTSYLKLIEALERREPEWPPLPGAGEGSNLDWGCAPEIQVAVKPTALYPLANPMDFEGSVKGILIRLRRIAERVAGMGGFLCIDMESYRYKGITLELYRRLKLEFHDYPHIGIGLQAYLRDTDRDLETLLEWARRRGTPISIRLVKGAYWDYETVRARQMGWEIPVWGIKAESDAAFERQAALILKNHDICHFACASHNIRSISAVMETAEALTVPPSRYEFQVLYGMAEPVRKAILRATGRVRLYCPFGEMVPGMGYLVRRLLENTANESFLRQGFAGEMEIERLIEDPAVVVERERMRRDALTRESPTIPAKPPPFRNEPQADFTRADHRDAFPQSIAELRSRLEAVCPLFIDGREVVTDDRIVSVNPARPDEVVGRVCMAGIPEMELAVRAATEAFPEWRETNPRERAGYLIRAAELARRQLFNLAALQVLEIGKQWDQAHADVTEAIDFFEYYAREMIRLGEVQRLGVVPGESNGYFYEPRGVAAVIAPWNFPLAISAGMVSAAIVTGNTVLYKPSGLTPLTGWRLSELFREAGLPRGVFNFVPGRSGLIGDALVEHPGISLIAFTGSREVGLRIIARAARVHPGQANVKRVVVEMGGKNAVIVDDDADLDEAIPGILASAFGFQGQKCSACSRVIVLDTIYERFVERLVDAVGALRIGPPEDPAFAVGPVADEAAREKILNAIAVGREEGRLIYQSAVPDGEGYWVPLTIIEGITPHHRTAQEEIFGPVLAVMKVKDFDQAIEWANSTEYALTGGLFSRSPARIARAGREFRVGNLYINRAITGAIVGRQPFGGSRMSGAGTKAGGPDYLLHFMDPRVVTENTMRRGFAPEA